MEFTFTWTIDNFSGCLQQNREVLSSPSFSLEEPGQTLWHLLLYPRGVEDDRDISLYLHRHDSDGGPESVTLDYELSFLSNDKISPGIKVYVEEHSFRNDHGFGVASFVFRDDIFDKFQDNFLPGDTLTVCCRIGCSDNPVAGECHAHTRIGVEKGFFTWDIADFSSLKMGEERTLEVAPESDSYPTLTMRLVPKKDEDLRGRNFDIQIIEMDVQKVNFTTFKISVLDASRKALDFAEEGHMFKVEKDMQVWTFPSLLTKSQLTFKNRLYLPNDVLSLKCECIISIGVELNRIKTIKYKSPKNQTNEDSPDVSRDDEVGNVVDDPVTHGIKMSQVRSRKFPTQPNPAPVSLGFRSDLQCMFEDGILSDLTLRAGGEIFPVHKAILSSRSPVFKAMFGCDMRERNSEMLDIPDLNAETLHRMLMFVYTDTVPDMNWEASMKLYSASDKYEMAPLKELCSIFLVSNLTATNVSDVLLLADMHQDNRLKLATYDFMLVVDRDVFLSTEWETFEKQYFDLASYTLKNIYVRKYLS